MKNGKTKESLCATCMNIDCSWHEWFEPVEGWTATPTIIKDKVRPMQSYQVTACPLYKTREQGISYITLKQIEKITCINKSTVRRRIQKGKQIFINGKVVRKEYYTNRYYLEEAQI